MKGGIPRWGKDKPAVLLHRQRFSCSASTVGRIINRLKARGILHEPTKNHGSVHRRGLNALTP